MTDDLAERVAKWPYKVVALEPGMADVIDRATGETVGYVLQNYYRDWDAYEYEGKTCIGRSIRGRGNAADRVWRATHGEVA